jgi:hypothetical protein
MAFHETPRHPQSIVQHPGDQDTHGPAAAKILPSSPEGIAYLLFRHIIELEGLSAEAGRSAATSTRRADRHWILNTYAECLRTVRDPDSRKP